MRARCECGCTTLDGLWCVECDDVEEPEVRDQDAEWHRQRDEDDAGYLATVADPACGWRR